jgi:hypothetical protein
MAHVSGGENEAQCVGLKIDALGGHEPKLHQQLIEAREGDKLAKCRDTVRVALHITRLLEALAAIDRLPALKALLGGGCMAERRRSLQVSDGLLESRGSSQRLFDKPTAGSVTERRARRVCVPSSAWRGE